MLQLIPKYLKWRKDEEILYLQSVALNQSASTQILRVVAIFRGNSSMMSNSEVFFRTKLSWKASGRDFAKAVK